MNGLREEHIQLNLFASFVNNNYLDNKPEFKELYPKDEDFGFNAFTGNKCPDFNYLENLSHNV